MYFESYVSIKCDPIPRNGKELAKDSKNRKGQVCSMF